jgi:hypothetical protein
MGGCPLVGRVLGPLSTGPPCTGGRCHEGYPERPGAELPTWYSKWAGPWIRRTGPEPTPAQEASVR